MQADAPGASSSETAFVDSVADPATRCDGRLLVRGITIMDGGRASAGTHQVRGAQSKA